MSLYLTTRCDHTHFFPQFLWFIVFLKFHTESVKQAEEDEEDEAMANQHNSITGDDKSNPHGEEKEPIPDDEKKKKKTKKKEEKWENEKKVIPKQWQKQASIPRERADEEGWRNCQAICNGMSCGQPYALSNSMTLTCGQPYVIDTNCDDLPVPNRDDQPPLPPAEPFEVEKPFEVEASTIAVKVSADDDEEVRIATIHAQHALQSQMQRATHAAQMTQARDFIASLQKQMEQNHGSMRMLASGTRYEQMVAGMTVEGVPEIPAELAQAFAELRPVAPEANDEIVPQPGMALSALSREV